MRISSAVASMSASVRRPLPRRPVKTVSRRSERVSNTARPSGGIRVRAPPHHLPPGYPGAATGLIPARPSGGAALPDLGRDEREHADQQRSTAVGAGPLGTLRAVAGVTVDARRLHELPLVA